MGSLFSQDNIQDPNVILYLEVDKAFYDVGDNVRGIAYLILKNNVEYNTLAIRF